MDTILAVDNDSDFLEELKIGLEASGFHVMTAKDPLAGMNIARKIKPSCIMFDLRMPEKHGLQFFEELKGDPSLKYIPAIAMSGFYTSDYDLCLSIFGIKRFLKKPFLMEDALKMIKSALKR